MRDKQQAIDDNLNTSSSPLKKKNFTVLTAIDGSEITVDFDGWAAKAEEMAMELGDAKLERMISEGLAKQARPVGRTGHMINFAMIDPTKENFAKVLKIKGLGAATIEKLRLGSIIEIYELTLDEVRETIGDKLAIKLIKEITNTAYNIPLQDLLPAFSIPLIGKTASNKLRFTFSKKYSKGLPQWVLKLKSNYFSKVLLIASPQPLINLFLKS